MLVALRSFVLLLAAAASVLAQPSSAPAAAAGSANALPDCALLVFRHCQKTGGSTLRNFFRLQEATGDWEFYRRAMAAASYRTQGSVAEAGAQHGDSPQGDRNWPEVTNRKRLELLHRFWEALESPATNFTHTPMRLIMEWHAEAHLLPPWERTVEVVSWLRRAARRRGCPVMLLTLVRHPVDLYASWYKYEGMRIAKGQGMLDWVADNPNLQAATMMAGVSRPAALPFVTRLHEGRSDRMAVWDPRDAAVLRVLLSQFDLIAPMERFDEALTLMCETMRFATSGYVRLNEGIKRDMWSMYRANLSAADVQRLSSYGRGWQPRADSELVQAVERVASVDMRMYMQATYVFDKQIRAQGASFLARLAALNVEPDEDGWRGERPPLRFQWRSSPQALPGALRTLPHVLVVNRTLALAETWSFVPTPPSSEAPSRM